MDIVRIGLDLAKSVFQVHGVGRDDQAVLRKTLRREAVIPFFAQLPPCLMSTAEQNPATWRRKTRPVAWRRAPWRARSSDSWRVPWRIGPQGQSCEG